jgi:hypothetical protein
MDTNEQLLAALAAILNALEAAGEQPMPITARGHSSIATASGSVDADKKTGRWIVR